MKFIELDGAIINLYNITLIQKSCFDENKTLIHFIPNNDYIEINMPYANVYREIKYNCGISHCPKTVCEGK